MYDSFMTERKEITQEEAVTQEAIKWSQEWGVEYPAEIKAEMLRIEEKAQRILAGSGERLSTLEIYYLNNKDNELF